MAPQSVVSLGYQYIWHSVAYPPSRRLANALVTARHGALGDRPTLRHESHPTRSSVPGQGAPRLPPAPRAWQPSPGCRAHARPSARESPRILTFARTRFMRWRFSSKGVSLTLCTRPLMTMNTVRSGFRQESMFWLRVRDAGPPDQHCTNQAHRYASLDGDLPATRGLIPRLIAPEGVCFRRIAEIHRNQPDLVQHRSHIARCAREAVPYPIDSPTHHLDALSQPARAPEIPVTVNPKTVDFNGLR